MRHSIIWDQSLVLLETIQDLKLQHCTARLANFELLVNYSIE